MEYIKLPYDSWSVVLANFYDANKYILKEAGIDLDQVDISSKHQAVCYQTWPVFVPTQLTDTTIIVAGLEDVRRKRDIAMMSGLDHDNKLIRIFGEEENCLLERYSRFRDELVKLYGNITVPPIVFVEKR